MARPFNIATDLEVSIYTYPSDAFIWGVTRWDNGDKWSDGTDTEAWQVISCDVVSVYTSNGLLVDRGYTRPVVSTATITYTGTEYDPFQNTTIRPGTPVRVRAKINPDTMFETWLTLWQGVVTNCVVSYDARTWRNLVSLDCEQELRDVLNYIAQAGISVTASPCYAKDFIDEINTQAGSNIQASTTSTLIGYELDPLSVSIPVNFGNLLNTLTDTNLGALFYRPKQDPTKIWYYTEADILVNAVSPNVVFEGEPSATVNRADFSDIVVGFDTAQYVNTLNYFTASGVDDVAQNTDSVDLVGNLNGEVTTRHYWATDADQAAEKVVATIPTRAVEQITAPVILRDSGQINNYLLLDPLEKVQVSVNNASVIIDETYYVTNVAHEITRDFWNVTLDLWIGR